MGGEIIQNISGKMDFIEWSQVQQVVTFIDSFRLEGSNLRL